MVHQHFSLEVNLFRWLISKLKIQSGSRGFSFGTNCNSLVFEVRLSRYDPDASL